MGIPGRIGSTRPFAEIARGTTTSVYKAYDEDADRVVAVKLLHQQWLNDADLSSRFLAESEALRSVSDKHVVAILQSGACESGLYIVTEFVDGVTLSGLLQQRTVPSAFAVYVLRNATAGLVAVHESGIVHRDFKPANIMVADSGDVKLADFGLAGSSPGILGGVAGTPDYLAPEVVAGHPANYASDVFSVGVSLFETLSGRLPTTHLHGQRASTFQLSRADDSLLATLDTDEIDVIRRLTNAAPEQRPRDAAAALPLLDRLASQFEPTPDAADFQSWLAGDSVVAPRRIPTSTAGSRWPAEQAEAAGQEAARPTAGRAHAIARARRSYPARRTTAALAALLLITVAVVAAWRSSRERATAENTARATENVEGAAETPSADGTAEAPSGPENAADAATATRAENTAANTAAIATIDTSGTPSTSTATVRDPESPATQTPAPATGVPAHVPVPFDTTQRSLDRGNADTDRHTLPAYLAVSASPWAQVLIDGAPVGTTPITSPLSIEPGVHELTLRHPDFPDYVRSIDARAADTSRINVSMWRSVARLNLTVSPWAEVLINDAVRDTTPIQSDLIIPPGETQLTLRHPTLGSWSTALNLRADSTYVMRFNLFELTQQ